MLVLLVESTHQWPSTSVSFIKTSFCHLPVKTGQPLAKYTFSCAKRYRTRDWRQDAVCTRRFYLAITYTHHYIWESTSDETQARLFMYWCYQLPLGPHLWFYWSQEARLFWKTAFPSVPLAIPGPDTPYWDQHGTNSTGVKPLTSVSSVD